MDRTRALGQLLMSNKTRLIQTWTFTVLVKKVEKTGHLDIQIFSRWHETSNPSYSSCQKKPLLFHWSFGLTCQRWNNTFPIAEACSSFILTSSSSLTWKKVLHKQSVIVKHTWILSPNCGLTFELHSQKQPAAAPCSALSSVIFRIWIYALMEAGNDISHRSGIFKYKEIHKY